MSGVITEAAMLLSEANETELNPLLIALRDAIDRFVEEPCNRGESRDAREIAAAFAGVYVLLDRIR